MTPVTTAPSVLIRAARGSDGPALLDLAALDSALLPQGELLVAEADGELLAALEPASGRHIADPFRPTADLVRLLARAASLGRGGRTPRRTLGIRRPGWRRAAPAVSSP
jgi:hypothetical protein